MAVEHLELNLCFMVFDCLKLRLMIQVPGR